MTKMFYFTRIGPCGMATGLDIGLGNMSLKFISLTFYSLSSLGTSPNSTDILFSHVQILISRVRSVIRLRLQARTPLFTPHCHNC